MDRVIVKKLVWDDWNTNHIRKHNIAPTEVEQSLQDPFAVFIKSHSGRAMSLGRSGKRLVATVLQKQTRNIHIT